MVAARNHHEGEYSQQQEARNEDPIGMNIVHSTVDRDFLVSLNTWALNIG